MLKVIKPQLYTDGGSYHLGDWVEIITTNGYIHKGFISHISKSALNLEMLDGDFMCIPYKYITNMKLLSENERKSLEGKHES